MPETSTTSLTLAVCVPLGSVLGLSRTRAAESLETFQSHTDSSVYFHDQVVVG